MSTCPQLLFSRWSSSDPPLVSVTCQVSIVPQAFEQTNRQTKNLLFFLPRWFWRPRTMASHFVSSTIATHFYPLSKNEESANPISRLLIWGHKGRSWKFFSCYFFWLPKIYHSANAWVAVPWLLCGKTEEVLPSVLSFHGVVWLPPLPVLPVDLALWFLRCPLKSRLHRKGKMASEVTNSDKHPVLSVLCFLRDWSLYIVGGTHSPRLKENMRLLFWSHICVMMTQKHRCRLPQIPCLKWTQFHEVLEVNRTKKLSS